MDALILATDGGVNTRDGGQLTVGLLQIVMDAAAEAVEVGGGGGSKKTIIIIYIENNNIYELYIIQLLYENVCVKCIFEKQKNTIAHLFLHAIFQNSCQARTKSANLECC
jgi:hypothetical protein